jgi:hypothetical protein
MRRAAPAVGAAAVVDDVYAVLYLGQLVGDAGAGDDQHNMSLLIGDAFSAGPIASILSPFVLGMLVDRFFASQKVMAVMHLAGGDPVVCPAGAGGENGALLIGLLFGYTLCYMPTLALTNNIAFHSLAISIKPSRWCACSAPSAGLSPGSLSA